MKHLKQYKKIIKSIYANADKEKIASIFSDKEKFSRVKKYIDDNPEVQNNKNIPQYKIGDYIILKDTSPLVNAFNKVGKVLDAKIGIYNYPTYEIRLITTVQIPTVECSIPEVREINIDRLATPEEIEQYEIEKKVNKYNL